MVKAPTFGTSAREGHPVLMLKPLPHELVAHMPNMPNHPGLNHYFDAARAELQARAEREARQERELAAARRHYEEALAQQQHPPRLPPLARISRPASPPPPRRDVEKMRYPWEHGYEVAPAAPTPRPPPQPPPQRAVTDVQHQRYQYPSPRDHLLAQDQQVPPPPALSTRGVATVSRRATALG